ncbi:hypothetical protein FB451DRAFT_1250895 [Mycena latifolia]|nr:hypothetical protein FB451DRAFT_1250895 [Mycena latifolia]
MRRAPVSGSYSVHAPSARTGRDKDMRRPTKLQRAYAYANRARSLHLALLHLHGSPPVRRHAPGLASIRRRLSASTTLLVLRRIHAHDDRGPRLAFPTARPHASVSSAGVMLGLSVEDSRSTHAAARLHAEIQKTCGGGARAVSPINALGACPGRLRLSYVDALHPHLNAESACCRFRVLSTKPAGSQGWCRASCDCIIMAASSLDQSSQARDGGGRGRRSQGSYCTLVTMFAMRIAARVTERATLVLDFHACPKKADKTLSSNLGNSVILEFVVVTPACGW